MKTNYRKKKDYIKARVALYEKKRQGEGRNSWIKDFHTSSLNIQNCYTNEKFSNELKNSLIY